MATWIARGTRVEVVRLGCWNGTPPHPSLASLVGRIGVVAGYPYGTGPSRTLGEATYTVRVPGFGEVRLRPEEIAPLKGVRR